jgi:hypothetical protein
MKRPPDEIVGHWSRPQTYRWVLFRRPWGQAVLNRHIRSDAPVLHDHEWPNVTIVLRGRAREWLQNPFYDCTSLSDAPPLFRHLWPGRIVCRRATDLHWIELAAGEELWTLFITGRKCREFGYRRHDGRWTRWDQSPDVDNLTRFRK